MVSGGNRRQNSRCVTPLGLGTDSRWNRSSRSSGAVQSRSPRPSSTGATATCAAQDVASGVTERRPRARDEEAVAKWIAEVERERKTAQGQLCRVVPGGKLTKSQARALVEALHDIVEVLADADPQDKAELYAELGVSLTYHTDGRVAVQALPRGVQVRVGGGVGGETCGLTQLPRSRALSLSRRDLEVLYHETLPLGQRLKRGLIPPAIARRLDIA
jgi:hypothetical protein